MTTPRIRMAARALAAAALGLGCGAYPAFALPPTGAGSDTPGTSSSVSPSTIEQCGTLSYQVSGFPAGETVYVKIDDGAVSAGDQSIQGQGVVATAAIDSSGTATGSFEIPCSLSPGQHWLRYLASAPIVKDGATVGTEGYTNAGNSYFTVVAASNDAASTASATTLTLSDEESTATTTTVSETGTAAGQVGAASAITTRTGGNTVIAAGVADAAGVAASGSANDATNAATNAATNTAGDPTLDATAAKATGGTVSTGTTSGNGIFTKDVATTAQAAATGSGQAPYIGIFVGAAILLVGMTAINVWVSLGRRTGGDPK